MDACVARQPIFDRNLHVYGYELLFRSCGSQNQFDGTEAAEATSQVLANSLLAIGLNNLVGSVRAFVNFGRDMLLDGWGRILPKERAVIEVLETVAPDEDVLAACRAMRRDGYRIALDDFVAKPGYEKLPDVADIVKVEIRGLPKEKQPDVVASYHQRHIQVLAEKVETYEDFAWARKGGYDYFQGFFFARPAICRARQIPASKVHCLRLIHEAQQPEINYLRLEQLIQADVAFTYKLLRHINSALYGARNQIDSVRQALVILGEEAIRRWVVLAALLMAAEDKPPELARHSIARARMCEALAERLFPRLAPAAFLMGMFSLLDALLDLPLPEALAQVNLAPAITAALVGLADDGDPLAGIYRLVLAYESGGWDSVDSLAASVGTNAETAAECYKDAIGWATETMGPF